jgi:hypothetical protein
VNSVGTEHFQPSDFIRAEALGTDTPACYTACCNFKECQSRAESISFKKNKEYEVIINSLTVGRGEKELDSLILILCLPLDLDRQLPPGQEVHGDLGVTPNQEGKATGVQQPVL